MKTHLRLAVILETFPKKEEQREFDGSAKNKNRETKTERRAKKKRQKRWRWTGRRRKW